MKQSVNLFIKALASDKFFWIVLAFFGLEAAWVALSFRYPLPFDEYYHYGLIQIYSHHISPIIGSQPHSADLYGDIVHYPSYLYHYLMSFPYRVIEHFAHTATSQIIALRLINILIFCSGFFVFRKAFLNAKISKAGINATLLFFALLPNTSFLAAHINYDSLLFLGTALSVYLCQKVMLNDKQLEFKWLSLLLATNILVCLVQYSFLPIFMAEVIFLGWLFYKKGKGYCASLAATYKKTSRSAQILLVLLLIVSSFLFLQRIGMNVIRYKTPAPKCTQILSVDRCMHNPAFYNSYAIKKQKVTKVSNDPILFFSKWSINMESGYFVTGANTATGHIGTAKPSMILRYAFAFLLSVGVMLSIYYWRDLKRNKALKLYLAIALVYALVLWLQNYTDYIHVNGVVAINARYLIPVMPLMLIIVQMAYSMLLKNRQGLKLLLFIVILLIFTQGGGIITSLVNAEPSWYWQRQKVINTNLHAKEIINHFEI